MKAAVFLICAMSLPSFASAVPCSSQPRTSVVIGLSQIVSNELASSPAGGTKYSRLQNDNQTFAFYGETSDSFHALLEKIEADLNGGKLGCSPQADRMAPFFSDSKVAEYFRQRSVDELTDALEAVAGDIDNLN